VHPLLLAFKRHVMGFSFDLLPAEFIEVPHKDGIALPYT
jgi:hypothetical protein